MIKKLFKHTLLSVLSICLACSQILVVNAETNTGEIGVTTDAMIIADNYDRVLSAQEKAILENESIKITEYTYQAPTGTDDLITIDALEKTIRAQPYTDVNGNIWVAVSATLIEGADNTEITFTDGVANYTTSGENYRFEVLYEARGILENQQVLLNTPHYLVSVYEAVEQLYELRAELNSVCDYVDELLMLTDGTFMATISDKEATQAIKDLNTEVRTNGELYITTLLKDYATLRETTPQKYIFEDGSILKQRTETFYSQLSAIVNCEGIATVIAFAPKLGFEAEAAALDSLVNGIFAKIIVELEDILSGDKWTALEYDLLSNVTDPDLVNLLTYASGKTSKHSASKTELSIASTTISKSMNQHNVTVRIYANVIDSETIDSTETMQLLEEHIIPLDNGISAKQVLSAIEKKGVEDEVLEKWSRDYQVGTDHYTRITSEITGDLLSDIEYTITYTPKEYEVTGNISGIYPYGYNLALPKSSIIGSVVDYAINDGLYDDFQGEVYRIVGPTNILSRVSKQRSSYRLLDIIAKDPTYNPNSNSIYTDIMTNKAVRSIVSEYSKPDENDQLITVTTGTGGYTLIAKTYPSGIDGMTWIPVAYQIDGTTDYISFTDNSYTETLTGYVSGVTVKYGLKITKRNNSDKTVITDSYVLEQANIANNLLKDAPKQIDIIRQLVSQKSNLRLGSTIYTALGALSSEVSDKKVINAINILKNNCFNKDNANHLYVYEYIEKVSTDAQCLAAYYEHYDDFYRQVELLDKYLAVVIEAPEFEEMLINMQMEAYVSRLDDIQTLLANVYAQLKAYEPSDSVDGTHSSANDLFETLASGGTVETFTTGNGAHDYTTVYQATDGKVSISLQYNVLDSDSNVTYTDSVVKIYEVGYVLTEEDVAELTKLKSGLYVPKYNEHYVLDSASTFPSVGTVLNASMIISEIYMPRTYNVYLKDLGANTQTKLTQVSVTNTQIPLEKHPTMGYRYDYVIAGVTKSASTEDVIYTIPADVFDSIFSSPDATLIVERNAVNISSENIITSFKAFNNVLGNNGTKFVLTENALGEYAVVLRLSTNDTAQMQNMLMNFATELMGSKINYLALSQNNDEHAVWAKDAKGDSKLSIQAIIDAVLESGIDMNRIINLIDINGNINENVESLIYDYNKVVVGNDTDLAQLGGMVIDSTLYVGDNLSVTEMPFYISIQDFDTQASQLLSLRNSLISTSSYLEINTGNDTLNTIGTMPEQMYQMVLAYMLFNGYVDIENLSEIEVAALMENLYDQMKDMVVNDELTSKTIQNTMNQLGVQYDTSSDSESIDKMLNTTKLIMENVELHDGVENGNVYSVTMTGNVFDVLQIFGVNLPSAILPILREKELSLPTSMTFTNFYETYEALIMDDASSTKFTTDLSEEKLSNNAVVILTSDISDHLLFDSSVMVNLNGQSVASISTSESTSVQVFDSSFAPGNVGQVAGHLTILGGNYNSGLTEGMLPNGYETNGTAVESVFYTLTEENGAIMLALKPAIINALSIQNDELISCLTTDLALRIFMNCYPNSSMKIDDYAMYGAIKYEDLIATIKSIGNGSTMMNDAFDAVDCNGVSSLINDFIAKMVDFETLSNTIAVGKYTISSTQWNTKFDITDEDYITVGVGGTKERTSKKLFVKLADDTMCSLFNQMNRVATIQAESGSKFISLNSIDFNETLNIDFEGKINLALDYTNYPEYTKLMGIILAQGNATIIEPLKNYISTGATKELIAAVEQTTEKQVVSAIKNSSGKTLTQLLTDIDISSTANLDYVSEIYEVYASYIQLTANMLIKAEEVGANIKLGTYKADDSLYVINKEDESNVHTQTSFKPFAKNYIEMTIMPAVDTSKDLIYGYSLDIENNVITLDLHRDGIKESEINEYGKVWFNVFNGIMNQIIFEKEDGIVSNGETVTIVLNHAVTGEEKSYTYKVRILGDVNGNGLIENNDILWTYQYYLGSNTLEDDSLWAADINGNGFIENNDTLKMQCKWLLAQEDNQITYTSRLDVAIKGLGGKK